MKLAIGTAQFGMDYGIANDSGQIPFDEICSILSIARAHGINYLDTASNYGSSEEKLGKIGLDGWRIVTKLPPLPSSVIDVDEWVFERLCNSLKLLKVSEIDGLLLHQPEDILGVYGDSYLRALSKIKDSGVVRNIGYSIYSPDCLGPLTQCFWPDVVQAPYNIFDQRIRTSAWLDKLFNAGTKIHARSVFLQGLLAMKIEDIPLYFSKWGELFDCWHDAVSQSCCTPIEAALCHVLSEEKFDRVVIGVDNLDQLKKILKVYKVNIFSDFRDLASEDLDLIEPYRWGL